MKKGPRAHKIGRNAGNGKFTPVERARRFSKTHVVELLPNPGYGDSKKK